MKSAIAHKVAGAVVNGATSTSQKVVKSVVKGVTSAGKYAAESVLNNAIDSTKKWIVGKRRSIQSLADPIIVPQQRKFDIDSLMSTMSINRRVGLISTFLGTLPFTSRIKMKLPPYRRKFIEDGTRYAGADAIALANDGVMHLFSNVKYELAGQECLGNASCSSKLRQKSLVCTKAFNQRLSWTPHFERGPLTVGLAHSQRRLSKDMF